MSLDSIRKVFMLAALALLASAGGASAAPPARKPKLAATPAEAVRLYHQALRSGDLEGSLAYVARPVRNVWEVTVRMVRTVQEFENALDERFGKDPRHQRMFDLGAEMRQLRRFDVRGQAETREGVVVTVWKTRAGPKGENQIIEETFLAQKDGHGWTLRLPPPFSRGERKREKRAVEGKEVTVWVAHANAPALTPELETGITALLTRGTATIKFLTREVKRGQYESRQEAITVFHARMRPEGPSAQRDRPER